MRTYDRVEQGGIKLLACECFEKTQNLCSQIGFTF